MLSRTAASMGVYRLAADMSDASYIFIGEHDAGLMHNDLDLNVLDSCYKRGIERFFIH